MKSPFITRMKSKSGRTKTKFSTTVNSSKNRTGIMGGGGNAIREGTWLGAPGCWVDGHYSLNYVQTYLNSYICMIYFIVKNFLNFRDIGRLNQQSC